MIGHTRSNAAIFCPDVEAKGGSEAVSSGMCRATRRVAGESLSGLLSVHVVQSLGFWEVGVKKLAIALSGGTESDETESRHEANKKNGVFSYSRWESALCASGAAGKRRGRSPRPAAWSWAAPVASRHLGCLAVAVALGLCCALGVVMLVVLCFLR